MSNSQSGAHRNTVVLAAMVLFALGLLMGLNAGLLIGRHVTLHQAAQAQVAQDYLTKKYGEAYDVD